MTRGPLLVAVAALALTAIAAIRDIATAGLSAFPLALLSSVIILSYCAAMQFFSLPAGRPTRENGNGGDKPADGPDRVSIAALAGPVLVVGENWRVVAANDSAIELLGSRLVGIDLRQAVRHPLIIEAVEGAREGIGVSQREVAAFGARDGAFRIRVIQIDGGRTLITFTDITQERLTERMRADFVANASHELRTPLASISGFIETLQGPAADDAPARHRFLDIMSREAARMSRLIDDLLSLSRIELDKYVRPRTALDLLPLMADVAKTLAMRMESHDRRLLIEASDDLPQVIADRDQILQVLHNLLSNALKYGRKGTPITLRATLEGGRQSMIRVDVVDQGDGIPPEHLPRLTERFYRVDTGRSRSMGGTGLGLAIVKHIVERHRGQLEINSQQGIGTTVSFLLPVAPVQSPRLPVRRQERDSI